MEAVSLLFWKQPSFIIILPFWATFPSEHVDFDFLYFLWRAVTSITCNFQSELTWPPVAWSSSEPILCTHTELCLLEIEAICERGFSAPNHTAKQSCWELCLCFLFCRPWWHTAPFMMSSAQRITYFMARYISELLPTCSHHVCRSVCSCCFSSS